MLTNALKAVAEFHNAGGAPVRWGPFGGVPDIAELKLRRRLIKEEAQELRDALTDCIDELTASEALIKAGDMDGLSELMSDAASKNPLVSILDGLCDLTYVVLGTALSLGFDLDAAFAEVHRSNMTKFPTTLREDGKVQKGPNYEAPDLARVLANQVLDIITGKRAPWDDVTTASGYTEGAISDFVNELQDDGATPEEVVEILGAYGIEARVEHQPGCGHDHSASDIEGYDDFISGLSKEPEIQSLDAALRELFSGADEHVAEAHQQSITDFLRDAGFQPELGVSG